MFRDKHRGLVTSELRSAGRSPGMSFGRNDVPKIEPFYGVACVLWVYHKTHYKRVQKSTKEYEEYEEYEGCHVLCVFLGLGWEKPDYDHKLLAGSTALRVSYGCTTKHSTKEYEEYEGCHVLCVFLGLGWEKPDYDHKLLA